MIIYCQNCLLPATKPDLFLNDKGKCAACVSFDNRLNINWTQREKEFSQIINEVKQKSHNNWDCVIPVSGGKDSTAQVLRALEYELKPLCVTSTTCDLSPLGKRNIDNIKNLGVDYIEVSPNPSIRSKLNKFCLEQIGDISWPEHVGIFTIPIKIAVQYKIPLILWGENSQNEYGGPLKASQSKNLDRRWLEEFGGLLGLRVSDLTAIHGFDERDLIYYQYPDINEINKLGLQGIFLGYFFPWDGVSNFLISQANGFTSYDKIVEGSIVSYENIDNFQTGIHDYFKFLKYGFGRATDIASALIRRGIISRDQGLSLVKKYDGQYPSSYLGKDLATILSKINLTVSEFDQICDRFTNYKLFKKDLTGQLIFDAFNKLSRVNDDN